VIHHLTKPPTPRIGDGCGGGALWLFGGGDGIRSIIEDKNDYLLLCSFLSILFIFLSTI
jgi:hypothetical protein